MKREKLVTLIMSFSAFGFAIMTYALYDLHGHISKAVLLSSIFTVIPLLHILPKILILIDDIWLFFKKRQIKKFNTSVLKFQLKVEKENLEKINQDIVDHVKENGTTSMKLLHEKKRLIIIIQNLEKILKDRK